MKCIFINLFMSEGVHTFSAKFCSKAFCSFSNVWVIICCYGHSHIVSWDVVWHIFLSWIILCFVVLFAIAVWLKPNIGTSFVCAHFCALFQIQCASYSISAISLLFPCYTLNKLTQHIWRGCRAQSISNPSLDIRHLLLSNHFMIIRVIIIALKPESRNLAKVAQKLQ